MSVPPLSERTRDLVVAVDAYRRAFADVLGLGVGEVLTLTHLDRHGPDAVSMVGARLGLGSSAATSLVDRMTAHGLVTRRPHPTDRRSTLVVLTARGRHAAEILGRTFADDVESAVGDLDPGLLVEVGDVLDRLAAALRLRSGDVNQLRRRLLLAELGGDPPTGALEV